MRSTNVYEEQSLGIYHDDEDEGEEGFETSGPRMKVWSRYVAMHARRQLAFGKLFAFCGHGGRLFLTHDNRYVVVGFGFVLLLYHWGERAFCHRS